LSCRTGVAECSNPASGAHGDVSASARYWAEDIVELLITVSRDGTIEAPSGHGIGYAVDEARIEALTVRRAEIHL
jgi:o-succinylbenzoate synthase